MENTKKSFGEIWSELNTEQTEYLKGYINRQRQDAVRHYQAEDLRLHIVSQHRELLLDFLKKQEYCGLVEILEDNFEHYVDDYLKNQDYK